ncbi:substrate-binding domain-containing protein [Aminipila sp.]|uniref:substrate-binding domain-containing protein n=1 Tax=Aminipila sp. TaxID=2060095 RepID=UPI002899C365|nr:substrate-binding domain-containing protein [Aminipila sp.]
MKKKNVFIALFVILSIVFSGCGNVTEDDNATKGSSDNTKSKGKIILATTTSTQDSGLLDVLLPEFTKQTGWEVDSIAVGTGEALKMGETGEADVLLVHAKSKEDAFIEAGYGLKRYDVMYNDFLIIGPKNSIKKNEDVKQTFKSIYDNQYTFVSRGDESGTHTKELDIWKSIGVTPTDNPNYVSAGQGMGATILMADEKNAYTLSDRATWLTTKEKTTLDIICEKDSQLLNYYGVIAVNPKLNSKINEEGAQAFVDWILSDETQKLIGDFGVEEYGESLFIPNATANE